MLPTEYDTAIWWNIYHTSSDRQIDKMTKRKKSFMLYLLKYDYITSDSQQVVICQNAHYGNIRCRGEWDEVRDSIETVSPEGTFCDTVQVPSGADMQLI